MKAIFSRKRMTAWLGLLAMCLVICAPTVSRLLAAAREITVPLCAESPSGGTHAVVVGVSAASSRADASPHRHGSTPLSDCGYCDLLAHEPATPTPPPVLPIVALLILAAFFLPPLRRFTPIGAFPAGRPRGPPRFS